MNQMEESYKEKETLNRSLNILISAKLDFGYCFLYCKFYEHNDILGNKGFSLL